MTASFADAWVTRRGAELLLGGRPFRFVGFNAYDLPFKAKAAEVDAVLRAASGLGLRVVRTWAFNGNPGSAYAFYGADGTPNEEQFRRVDGILESARRHGLKVILVLENYWPDYGGIAATAARFGVAKLEFFSDPRCRAAYQDHVANLVTRVNAISGRPYLDDPTLFAWELMNEPRIDAREDPTPDGRLGDPTGARLGAWLADMSRHVKSLDPRHLVGPGAEGHGFRGWGGTTEGWGADPLGVMDQPDVDFFTFHPYLNESWARHTAADARRLVSELVAAGHARGKPVLMEEWGINQTEPLFDPAVPGVTGVPPAEGRLIQPGAASFARARRDWYRLLLEAFRRAGGDGSLVWMLETGLREPHFGIRLDTELGPGAGVGASPTDLDILEVLAAEALAIGGGGGAGDRSE
jgi:mannan endo-1,4-beta-mannosidase